MSEAGHFAEADGDSEALGLSAREVDQIQAWMNEFEGPCERHREEALASHLSGALAGYMGIEREILLHAFLNAARRKTPRQNG